MPTPNGKSAARAQRTRDDPRPPSALLMLLEGRAPMEFFSLVAALPWLYNLPRGDGHPVLVYPGMGTSDITTLALRRYLQSLGYVTQAWGQGLNFGPRPGVIERAAADIHALAERHDVGAPTDNTVLRPVRPKMPVPPAGAAPALVVTPTRPPASIA